MNKGDRGNLFTKYPSRMQLLSQSVVTDFIELNTIDCKSAIAFRLYTVSGAILISVISVISTAEHTEQLSTDHCSLSSHVL